MPERDIGESFSDVVRGAVDGNAADWRTIYEAISPLMHSYARMHGALDPEDIVGEAFVHIARGIARFAGDERSFRSWALVITHHRIIDARRRVAARPEELVDPASTMLDSSTEHLTEDEAFAETFHTTASVLRRLSDDQRAVILLRFLGDLDVDEVARALRKKPGTVRVIQYRALTELRRLLAPEEKTDSELERYL